MQGGVHIHKGTTNYIFAMSIQRKGKDVFMNNELQQCYERDFFYGMIIVSTGITKNEDSKDGSQLSSIKQQEEWKIQLCTLEVCEGN